MDVKVLIPKNFSKMDLFLFVSLIKKTFCFFSFFSFFFICSNFLFGQKKINHQSQLAYHEPVLTFGFENGQQPFCTQMVLK